jgi:hypothetical protein
MVFKPFFHVLVSFRDLLSRIPLGNRSRSTRAESSRDSIARREISMTAPISPATVDSMLFQREWRRAFSGDESVIHCRRADGGIQSKAERNRNRKSGPSRVLGTRGDGSEIRFRWRSEDQGWNQKVESRKWPCTRWRRGRNCRRMRSRSRPNSFTADRRLYGLQSYFFWGARTGSILAPERPEHSQNKSINKTKQNKIKQVKQNKTKQNKTERN